MRVTHEQPAMFGIQIYDKHFLIFNQSERKALKRVARIMEQAREQVTDDSYLDMEFASIEGRLDDLLGYCKIEI